MKINWMEEVEKRKDALLADTQNFLRIKSVLNMEEAAVGAPFGTGVAEALSFMLNKGEADGFVAKNVDGYAGHLEMGQGQELIGILCHVDVVPEGDGWTSDPYGADIRDGNIYARGAIDDKGPTMAAYYAMKIVKELGLPLQKRVRMILGADEESEWRCVDHYFKKEEMPTMGFAPDADFPIINAEKGISTVHITMKPNISKGSTVLQEFTSGRRLNMVPDYAKAVLMSERAGEIAEQFASYGNAVVQGSQVTLEMRGVSAHGSTPEKGENAGVLLAAFLQQQELDTGGAAFVSFAMEAFQDDTRGTRLGVAYTDDITGDLTINVGTMSYQAEEGGTFGLNIRYPVTTDVDEMVSKMVQYAKQRGFEAKQISNSSPHHVAKEHVLIQTLQRVYEEQTGERAELLAIGGGTYARSLQAGVAFGPLFPGKEDLAHQKDEYIEIEDLVKATAIYAQAIYELAK
ncbi:dipeptidase PepV [Ectobacillus antri]|jgi:succinyl-diaminopimelate desuccinylase|uniref:Dipeptidase PepV n=1 Tax=Ectobacillus antri TaxID=2486280 RepID=A0ABT6H2T9_9BACI|nr:dipeptidase PepV [Ectobacillus antri]MDG4656469.1 dipeptidase PepV [Ectobacillus antri]MDG5753519.1 dipeptidase PepV [Ectobacillus antri]